jgi:hypothetical protein
MPLIGRQAWTRHLRIPFGNLLGVTLTGLMILPVLLTAATFSMKEHPPRWLLAILAALILLGPLSAVVVDCRWRWKPQDAGRIERWISPFEGGTLVIFPIWFVGMMFFLAVLYTMAKEWVRVAHRLPF